MEMKTKKSPLNVVNIVETYLRENGYDGLSKMECGCGVDDIAPCCEYVDEGIPQTCVPSYRVEGCHDPGACEYCGADMKCSHHFSKCKPR